MPEPPSGPGLFRRRLVGLFALTLMEREGPLHGYGLSERIAEKTEGAWRPGPGSVYPSLQKLTETGLANVRSWQRRREYTITASGRALLERIRHQDGPFGRPRPDLSALWAEVLGTGDVDELYLLRLRRAVEAIEGQLSRHGTYTAPAARLRAASLAVLAESTRRLRLQARARPVPRSSRR